jgi:hypothetical protein
MISSSAASTSTVEICSYQSKMDPKEGQIKALQGEAADAQKRTIL